jgi:hypothetical protein
MTQQSIVVKGRVMYWGDAYLNRIDRANLDGTGRTNLWITTTSTRYFAMALDSTFLYFTDWTKRQATYLHCFVRVKMLNSALMELAQSEDLPKHSIRLPFFLENSLPDLHKTFAFTI